MSTTATPTSHEITDRSNGAVHATTVADVMVATLKASGVRRVYGMPGGFDQRIHRRVAARRRGRVGARASRGGGSVRGRRRGRDDRAAGRVRRQLRARKPTSDQRPVRRQPQPGPGAGDRGAHPAGGDRQQLFPGDPPAGAVPRVQRLLPSWPACPSSCRGCWRSRCATRSNAVAWPWSWCPARSSCTTSGMTYARL